MPECTITGTLRNLRGQVLPSTKIVFERSGVVGQEGSVVIPRSVEVTSDASGVITVVLYPGSYTATTVGIRKSETFAVGVPDAPTADLADLINQLPVLTPSIVSQVNELRDQTQAIYDQVQVDLAAGNLTGADGADGQDGAPGADGSPGASAYEVAVTNGFVGTEAEWLESLQATGVAPSDVTTTFTLADGRVLTVTNGVITLVQSVPAQFGTDDWSLSDVPSAGINTLAINIIALPDDGASAITALQYRVDSGSGFGAWQTLSGTGTGARNITVLAETEADVQVRAVNAIGNGAESLAKTATPTSNADVTAPDFTAFSVGPQVDNTLPTSITVGEDPSTPFTAYIVGVATDDPAPSAAQIVAGTDSDDVAAPIVSSVSFAASGTTTDSIADPASGTYDFYAVVADAADNLSVVLSDLAVVYTAPATFTADRQTAQTDFSQGTVDGTRTITFTGLASGEKAVVALLMGEATSTATGVAVAGDVTASTIDASTVASRGSAVFIETTASGVAGGSFTITLTPAAGERLRGHSCIAYYVTGGGLVSPTFSLATANPKSLDANVLSGDILVALAWSVSAGTLPGSHTGVTAITESRSASWVDLITADHICLTGETPRTVTLSTGQTLSGATVIIRAA